MRSFSLSLLIVPMLIISGCSMMNDFGEFSFGQEQGSLDGGDGAGNAGGNDGGADNGGDSDGGNGGNNGGNNGPMVDGGDTGGTDAGPPIDPICAAATCDPVAICNSSTGVAVCACPMGYIDMNGDGTVCRDVNECKAGIDACDEHSVCENTPGNYKCNCNTGFFFDKVSNTCIDDCIVLVSTVCDDEALCEKPDGFGVCSCRFGFKDVSSAQDGSQCEVDASPCGTCDDRAFCDTTGTPTCVCKAGYSGDGKTCTDVNECLANSGQGDCDAKSTCENTVGGRTCTCKNGFTGPATGNGSACADIDECASASDNDCDDTNGTCSNNSGSYSCGCKSGFTGSNNNTVCTDKDECASGEALCAGGNSSICMNTSGSYTCTCKDTYTGDGRTCTDKDECALGTANCGAGVPCVNTTGSFQCGNCPAGLRKNASGDCVDINECAEDTDNCDPNATCTNVVVTPAAPGPPLFTCACKTGYDGNGTTCTDKNECLTNNGGCHADADCGNQPGADPTCTCKTGFSGNGLTGSALICTDINDCLTSNGGCSPNADCANRKAPLAPVCTCKSGFSGNGISCTDINECTLNIDTCDPLPDACQNRDKALSPNIAYECICPSGYSGTGQGTNGCCTPDGNSESSRPNDGKDNDCNGFIDRPVLNPATTYPAVGGAAGGSHVLIGVVPSAATTPVPKLQCRHYKRSGTPGPWADCPTNPIAPFNATASASASNNGAWRTEVRWLFGTTTTSEVTSYDYYVHNSMHNATKCPQLPDDAPWFAKAAERLASPTAGVFKPGTDSVVANPFIRITYDVPLAARFGIGAAGPQKATMRSLRRRYKFGTNTGGPANAYLLVTRNYVSATNGTCKVVNLRVHLTRWIENMIPSSLNPEYRDYSCDAIVLNRAGAGVCLVRDPKTGAIDFGQTNRDSVSNALGWSGAKQFMWRQFEESSNFSADQRDLPDLSLFPQP